MKFCQKKVKRKQDLLNRLTQKEDLKLQKEVARRIKKEPTLNDIYHIR